MSKILISLLAVISLFGCATKSRDFDYKASTLLRTSGKLQVGNFNYVPAEDKSIEANQIKTTGRSHFTTENNISHLFQNAMRLEFQQAGIEVLSRSNNLLTGSINKILLDDVGNETHTTMNIQYLFHKSGKECFNKTMTTKITATKNLHLDGLVADSIKTNIEELLKDSSFLDCIK